MMLNRSYRVEQGKELTSPLGLLGFQELGGHLHGLVDRLFEAADVEGSNGRQCP